MSNVKPMKKVSVSVRSMHVSLKGSSPSEPASFTFIYGIGRDGLSAFECCLDGLSVGEHVTFEVKASDAAEAFSGLFSTIRPLIEGDIMPEILVFNVEVKGLEGVDNREVVAALASSTSGCGSGGSCGCGCS